MIKKLLLFTFLWFGLVEYLSYFSTYTPIGAVLQFLTFMINLIIAFVWPRIFFNTDLDSKPSTYESSLTSLVGTHIISFISMMAYYETEDQLWIYLGVTAFKLMIYFFFVSMAFMEVESYYQQRCRQHAENEKQEVIPYKFESKTSYKYATFASILGYDEKTNVYPRVSIIKHRCSHVAPHNYEGAITLDLSKTQILKAVKELVLDLEIGGERVIIKPESGIRILKVRDAEFRIHSIALPDGECYQRFLDQVAN